MTAAEAAALLAVAKDHPRLGAYVILSLTTGIRTEEACQAAGWRVVVLPSWWAPHPDAILRPPKPEITPSANILQLAAEQDIELEAGG